MNILYISTVMAKKVSDDVSKKLKIPSAYSIQKFHNLILEGLNANENIQIRVLSGIPISRKHSKKLFWKRRYLEEENIDYIHLPFINFPIVKQLLISAGMLLETIRWIVSKKEKYIICDAAYTTVAPFIVFLAKIFNVKILAIVADIYDYMSDEIEREKKSLFRFLSRKVSKVTLRNYSGYILLTEAMNSIVNKRNKPYMVMEGLVDINGEKLYNSLENKYQEKICMYAGGMNERYGIKRLVEAFEQIKIENLKLHLYGMGDMETYLKNLQSDKIIYYGTADNKVIVQEETKATLLINPRLTNEQYTKYSFPSKTLEYMVSGTPVLTTRLVGIPKEYEDYIWYIEDETVNGIKNAIENIMSKDKQELFEKGKRAQDFVLKKKNNIVQTKRIVEFINCAL